MLRFCKFQAKLQTIADYSKTQRTKVYLFYLLIKNRLSVEYLDIKSNLTFSTISYAITAYIFCASKLRSATFFRKKVAQKGAR